jgi:hypothetical protein
MPAKPEEIPRDFQESLLQIAVRIGKRLSDIRKGK